MNASINVDLISELNELPINQAAKKWLPEDSRSGDGLHLAALALWGTWERNLANCFPDADQIEWVVSKLHYASPEAALIYLTELREVAEGVRLTAEMLEEAESAEHAALRVLEVVQDHLNEGHS